MSISNRLAWQGIYCWIKRRGITPEYLAAQTRYPLNRLKRALSGEPEDLPSNFLQDCVDLFGLHSKRARYEDSAYVLTDDECREALIESLAKPEQASFLIDLE